MRSRVEKGDVLGWTPSNDTCVKHSMAHQAYRVVNTHDHEISGWTILSKLLHTRAPYFGDINVYVQSDLANLSFKNREHLEYFHIIIFRLQQEINLSG